MAANTIEQAVIIAAGFGLPLGQLTRDRPRPMLPVLGKPIVIRVMDRMREAGIQQFVVVVGEHEGEVASYLNSSWVPDCKVQIVLQSPARGPADSLGAAAPYITGPFLLATCNHLTPSEQIPAVIKRFQNSNVDMILSVATSSEDTLGLPIAKIEGDRVISIAPQTNPPRRSMAAFMLYACGKRILNHTSGQSPADYEMAGAIQALITTGGRVGAVISDWHMQLAREIDLLTINKRFLREDRDTHILSELPESVHITPPVRIDPQVSIGPGAKIGPNVYLESGAHVGQEAVIWDSVVLQNADIANHEVVHGQIVTRRARISDEPLPDATRPRRPNELDDFLAARDKKDR